MQSLGKRNLLSRREGRARDTQYLTPPGRHIRHIVAYVLPPNPERSDLNPPQPQ